VTAAVTVAAPAPGPTPLWLTIVSLVLTAVAGGGGITALVLVVRQSRKIEADTTKVRVESAQVLTSATITLLQPLEERLAAAEEENARFRIRLRRVERHRTTVLTAVLTPGATIEGLRGIAVRVQEETYDRS
jgi:hypothetical protein